MIIGHLMNHVNIFTMCTNRYNEYLPNFMEKIDEFMPNYTKTIYIMSDVEPKFSASDFNTVNEIVYKHIFHQFYLFLHLSKIDFITQCLPETNTDLFFYFDVDTFFIHKEQVFWDKFYSNCEASDLIFEKHTCYIYHQGKNDFIQNETFANMKGASKFNYDENSVYVCGAMFGGKMNKLHEFKKHYDAIRIQDHREMYMGSWGDEHYLNRLVNDKTLGLNFKMLIGVFAYNKIVLDYFDIERVKKQFTNLICCQKYAIQLKEKIKKLEQ